jgi:hypothetical protein
MPTRRTADEGTRWLRDCDRDWAQGLTIPDIGPQVGSAETTSSRGRQRQDPARGDADRRGPALEAEVERLKPRVAELMLDTPRLPDVAPKKW